MSTADPSRGQPNARQRRSYGTGSLYVRTDRHGSEAWYAHWRVDGRQVKRRIGPKAPAPRGLNRKQAEARMRDLMAEITTEDLGLDPRPRRPGDKSIRELWDAYRADRGSRLKATTRHDYARVVANWFEPHFKEQAIGKITAGQVEALVAAMRAGRLRRHDDDGGGLRPRSIRNHLTFLSSLLTFAVRKGWIARNVVQSVTPPADEAAPADAELRFLEVWEVTDLAAHARPGLHREIDRALYVTAAMSGLRQGELLALRWECVDLARARLRVVRGITRGIESTPKSRKARSVPVAPPVAEALRELRERSRFGEPGDLVFADPASGGTLPRTAMMRRYREALTAAGLDAAFRFHDLRHTFGTTMARAGEPATNIQAWMGHSDLKTTEIYLHYAPGHDEAGRIAAAFGVADPRQGIATSGSNLTSPGMPERASEHLTAP